jgi:hypothetical protein
MPSKYDDYPESAFGTYGGKKYSITKELAKAAIRNAKAREDLHTSTETPLKNSTGESDFDNKD